MIKNILIILLACAYFAGNQFAYGKEASTKILKGSIVQNAKDLPEIIIFIPEGASTDLSEGLEVEFVPLDKLGSTDSDKITELKFSDSDKEFGTKDRLRRASAFMMLGGLSVTGSIQNSIGRGQAVNNLKDNFTRPVKKVKDGWRADDNMFIINYIGHPLEWFLLANYLKAAGASDKEAIIISQLTNITWEFVVEGNYVSPSPKDLVTNTLGSLAGVYLYNTVLNKPINATYTKLTGLTEKHGVELLPQVRYNTDTRGVVLGALIKIKK